MTTDTPQIKRYDMVLRSRGMESWQDLEQHPEGDYMLHSDHVAARAADKAEIERLRLSEWHWQQQAEKAEARIAELEKDAERWRYLRDSGDDSIYAMRFDLDGDVSVSGNDLDVSIDAAIAAAKPNPQGERA